MKFLRAWMIPLLILMLIWPGGSAKAESGDQITIFLDGSILQSDTPPYVKAKENVTMVPLRIISESLGAHVTWSSTAKSATIQKEEHELILVMGSNTARVDGNDIALDVSVENINGRTMVPLRFVSEQLGLSVIWNSAAKTITLTTESSNGDTVVLPPQPGSGAGTVTSPSADQEMRGVWISSVSNLDWPSKASYGQIEQQKQEYIQLLDEVEAMGINAVFVQVRPAADSLYPSKLVPWSTYLTGAAGKDPGYDPLAFMIEETHRRGIQFHAWFNPFRASTGSDASKLPDNHVANAHKDWIVTFGGKMYINPGIPAARSHIIEAIMEVVNGYDIDGVHLDDYFYPTGETTKSKFNDDATFKQYNPSKISNKGDWRRSNINSFVQELGEAVHQVKPGAAYGISPFGVWRNKSNDLTGSDTKAGITAYDSTYADVRAWIKHEWIDYVVPQIYWSMSRQEARYDILADWWANEVRGTRVKLYIGHAPYKLATPEIGWDSAEEIISQLEYNRSNSGISGSIFFSAKDLRRNPLGIIQRLTDYYRTH
ncbi:hypothetical protein J41TS12_38440 [Paenibacillus antibioticophila]|uniref:Family 10 glycosylhydrolase n=1 Tax=Paenibacillus antibioticophila TaxID=1274374 RepID=A0A920CIQ8_9BACL|nr:family 10 glycosylhydrolase [Paenibacillus antibioticophila]GIO38983.1 hypothetical protein J41TS12_38440 [Paenibacillus antibioticophila]